LYSNLCQEKYTSKQSQLGYLIRYPLFGEKTTVLINNFHVNTR
jgi:hypothetical protein